MVDRDIGHALIESGYAPGVLFSAPGASFVVSTINSDGIAGDELEKTVRERERLVLISHPCDITSSDENYVESLICKREKPDSKFVTNISRNSPRYFVVHPEIAWVASATNRVKISKASLLSIEPTAIMDEETRDRFVSWLTRRYDRPIVPDDIVERFNRPVTDLFGSLAEVSDADYLLFNNAVHDIRMKLPDIVAWPCSISLIYLTKSITSKAEFEAIWRINERIASAAGEHVNLADPEIVPYGEIPYGVILRSHPLMLEYLSHSGEESAAPLRVMGSSNYFT